MIKLIATDLDGTLLGKDRQVSEENKKALRDCEELGIKIALASGRTFQSVSEVAREIGVSGPIISNNGARADFSPDGPTLMEDVFPPELSEKVFKIMKASGIYFVCYGRERLYRINAHSAAEAGRGLNVQPDARRNKKDEFFETVDDESLMLSEGLASSLKYVAFTYEADKLNALRETLEGETDCALSSSWFDNIEVLAPGAGKGKAMRILQARFDIAREETMAFGDNLNDICLLRASGVPVAMENAVDDLKRVAAVIAPHHDCSGVAKVIRDRILCGKAVKR